VEGILTRMIVGVAKCFDLYSVAGIDHKSTLQEMHKVTQKTIIFYIAPLCIIY